MAWVGGRNTRGGETYYRITAKVKSSGAKVLEGGGEQRPEDQVSDGGRELRGR